MKLIFDIEKFRFMFVERNKKILIVISALLLLTCGYFSFKVFSNVRADAESLLPSDSRIMKDMRASRDRLPSVDCLLMFVDSSDPFGNKSFINDFAAKLRDSKNPIISRVVYNVKEEIDFFKANSPLYAPVWKLEELDEALFPPSAKDKWVNKWKRRLLQVTEKFGKESEAENKYALFKYLKYLPDGDLAARDGKTRAILIFYSKPMSDVKDAIELDKFIKGVIDEMDPSRYANDMEFRFSGLSYTLMNEYYALWDDLVVSISFTLILVILLVFFFFRTYRIVLPLLYSLITGVAVTFSIAYFTFKQLNSNSAFMASIIVGNAINPSIIFCSYFLNEMKRKRLAEDSLLYAIKMSFIPTLIGTAASTVAFGSLVQSESKGFFDFGVLGLWGMLIGWICTYIFLPPILTLKPFKLEDDFLNKYEMPLKKIWEKFSSIIFSASRKIGVACAVLFVVSAAYLLLVDYEYLERDTTKVRSKDYVSTNFVNFQRYLSRIKLRKEMFPSLLILTDTMENAGRLQQKIESDSELRRIEKDITAFTIYNLIPLNQEEKIKQIKNIKIKAKRIPDDMRGVKLSRGNKDLFDAILDSNITEPLTIDKLPAGLKEYFTEIDGSLGRMVFISVDLNQLERDIYRMIAFIDRINAISRETLGAESYNVNGLIPISTELAKMMIKDASRCIGIAFGAIIFVFLIFYRRVRLFSMMVLNFAVAMSAFLAIMTLLGIKINFLNFIALPMTFGIGVDYSTNIVQSALKRGDAADRMKTALVMTGPSVIVASLTTEIGYASLIFTKTMALSSFGTLCLIGELFSLAGALVVLPALYSFFYRDKSMKAAGISNS